METRKCKICGVEKHITSFAQRFAKKGDKQKYRRHQCNTCLSKKYRPTREVRRKITKRGREKYKANQQQIKRQLTMKIGQPKCKICGENDIVVLLFHHRDKSQKKFAISYGFVHSYGFDTLLREAKKCDVLCHNCHLKIHSKLPARYKDRILQHLKMSMCKQCRETDIRTLCFHHDDPKTKEFKLAHRFHKGIGWNRILAESQKCTVLCTNCHIRHHAAAVS